MFHVSVMNMLQKLIKLEWSEDTLRW